MNNKFPLEKLERAIGYEFADKGLILSALTHSSFVNELLINKRPDYQRQEFLGDAVLELTVSDYLYRNYPEMKEGQLTHLRASIVCEPTLAFCAASFGLSDYIIVGKGEDAAGLRYHESVISDVFEAIIGAIYLDSGIENASKFIFKFVLTDLDQKKLFFDAKSELLIWVQREKGSLRYELVSQTGPDNNRTYYIDAYVNGEKVSTGSGSSKKNAEQKAAYEALKVLRGLGRIS
ncbi:MAG: ribonuclease III [Lachnospiraceae bacterium]|nr:ribonuclease III [Lachnospiraceae bacterium]